MLDQAFDQAYQSWIQKQIGDEANPRRRELLRKGLGHGTIEFLRSVWYPAVGGFDDLYPEWEVRDFNNGLRYLDLAYMPNGGKGCIEIQGYRSHARDVDVSRFKDLCMKQALLALDDWLFLPIAYLSVKDEPAMCKQIVLSFIGKFASAEPPAAGNWAETETLRFARRLLRPFTAGELSRHLQLSERQTRRLLREMTEKQRLAVASGKQRYRTYRMR